MKCLARNKYISYRRYYEIMALRQLLTIRARHDSQAAFWLIQIKPIIGWRRNDIKGKYYYHLGWASWIRDLIQEAHIKCL